MVIFKHAGIRLNILVTRFKKTSRVYTKKKKKQNKSGLSRVTAGAGREKWIPDLYFAGQNNLNVSRQSGKFPISRKFMGSIPEYPEIIVTVFEFFFLG